MSPNQNTEWKLSAKGNLWRRMNGHNLIVGKTIDDRIWARIDENFINDEFETIEDAKLMCEWEAK